jgi:hypothetical protein
MHELSICHLVTSELCNKQQASLQRYAVAGSTLLLVLTATAAPVATSTNQPAEQQVARPPRLHTRTLMQ